MFIVIWKFDIIVFAIFTFYTSYIHSNFPFTYSKSFSYLISDNRSFVCANRLDETIEICG